MRPKIPADSILRLGDFRQIFLADSISQFGTQILTLALPLVAVVSLDASPLEVGALSAAESLPYLLASVPAGVWADRVRKRPLLLATDVARAALLLWIPIAWWTGLLTAAQLIGVAFVFGLLTVFFEVGYASYVPSLVPRERLIDANTRLQVVQSVAQAAGPGLGGALVQALAAPVAVLVSVGGYLWSAVCVLLVRGREPLPGRADGEPVSWRKDAAEGLRAVLGDVLLRRTSLSTACFNLFWAVGTPMIPVLLARDLGLSAGVIGLLLTFEGIGGLLGGVLAARAARRLGHGPAIWTATLVAGAGFTMVPLVDTGWRLSLISVGLFVSSAGMVVYNVIVVTFRQSITPDRLLGRVSAFNRLLVWSTLPLGAVLGGLLGQLLGARTTLWIAGLATTLSFLWIYCSPLRTLRDIPEDYVLGGSLTGTAPRDADGSGASTSVPASGGAGDDRTASA
ncbi:MULTISPECIES: MFS transporter [unclassified Streptomyces]|uniref:MFS transporter n=1 Tax=unclassified Streptomyces TaxID=2593676 RepID=UPI003325EB8B